MRWGGREGKGGGEAPQQVDKQERCYLGKAACAHVLRVGEVLDLGEGTGEGDRGRWGAGWG